MPMRFYNTFNPQTDFGRGLASLASALFSGGATPNETLESQARRDLWDAQTHAETQRAGLLSAQRGISEDQLYARREAPRSALLMAGGTEPDLERHTEWMKGGSRPMPVSVPGPTIPPPLMPAPAARAPTPEAQIARAVAAPEGPAVGGFSPTMDMPAGVPLSAEPPVPDHRAALGLSQPIRQTPPVGDFGPFESDPVALLGPGDTGTIRYPMNTPTLAAPVEIGGTSPDDDLMRRISSALAVVNLARMSDNPNLANLAAMYLEQLRNPLREDVLAGRIDPGDAGARMAATEPGKALYQNSPEGIFGLYSGGYEDTGSPAIQSGVAFDEARARAEDAQARLREAQIPREGAHADLYRAQAGYYNERDRSSSRSRGGAAGRPKALTTSQRKALQGAFDAWTKGETERLDTAADAKVDSELAMEIMSRAGDLMRDEDSEFFDDPESAIAAAISELAPEGFEASGNWLPDTIWPNRLTRKDTSTGIRSGAIAATPETAIAGRPIPQSKEQLIDGEVYATARGPARWNAAKQKFEQ